MGSVQLGFGHGVAAEYGGNRLGLGVVEANEMVVVVRDDDLALPVQAKVLGPRESGFLGGAVLGALFACAGQGEDASVGAYDPEGVAISLEDVEVALGVHHGGSGIGQWLLGGFLACLGFALLPVTREGLYDTGFEVDAAYALVVDVSDEEGLFVGRKTD